MFGVVGVVAALTVITSASSNISPSKFEGNDGNLVVNTPGNTDWDNAPNLSVGQDLPTGTSDNSFGQGTKENDTSVNVVTGSIPNSKADLARFAVAGEVIQGQTFMYIAWSRENQSGTVNFDFELNAAAQPDLTTPGPKTLNRTVNDVLINYAFQGGSNTPTLTKFVWNGTDWGTGQPISATCEEGATNSTPVSENLGGLPAVSRPAQQFGEAAINLTCAGIVQPNACESFGSVYVKSRSSTSFTSEIKDFIAPIAFKASNCGRLTIIKHTNPGGLNQDFSYTTTGGLTPPTFTLNDSGTNTQVFGPGFTLQPGTYTVTEGADPLGFAFASLSCQGAGGSSSGRVATAVIVGGSDITCTYINNQQLGAIKVTKGSTQTGNPPLAGAQFSVTGPGGFSQTLTTGADGTACVGGLVFGSYTVTETKAPDGYNLDDGSGHPVTVNVNTNCSGSPQTLSFTDTPLTDLSVEAKSEAVGGTKSTIVCKDAANNTVGTGGNLAEDSKLSATSLKPGTYTCTVVIDP
jgi:hypothetical protein